MMYFPEYELFFQKDKEMLIFLKISSLIHGNDNAFFVLFYLH